MDTIMIDAYRTHPQARRKGFRNWVLSVASQVHDVRDITVEEPRTAAYLNHARWIADCPFCDGAENVTLDDPVFMCISCGNQDIRGVFIRVDFPDNIHEIESLLSQRPDKAKNWEPHESIEFLVRENEQRGVK